MRQNPVQITTQDCQTVATVTSDNRLRVLSDPHATPALISGGARGPKTVNVTASGDTTLVAAPGAGLSIYVMALTAFNAGGVNNPLLKFKEGAAGTNAITINLANGPAIGTVECPIPWKLPENTALVVNASATNNCWVNIQYYVAP